MSRTGRVESGFWRNPKLEGLTDAQRLLLLYLFSCPAGNLLGCFFLPVETVAADLRWPLEQARENMRALVESGFVQLDETAPGWILIRGWLDHNPIKNPNHLKAAMRTIGTIPGFTHRMLAGRGLAGHSAKNGSNASKGARHPVFIIQYQGLENSNWMASNPPLKNGSNASKGARSEKFSAKINTLQGGCHMPSASPLQAIENKSRFGAPSAFRCISAVFSMPAQPIENKSGFFGMGGTIGGETKTPLLSSFLTETETRNFDRPKKIQRKSILNSQERALFEDFWQRYPVRKGKLAAERAFSRALKTADWLAISAGVDKLAAFHRLTGTRYCPHPATWLNHGRWMDEIAPDADSVGQHSRNGNGRGGPSQISLEAIQARKKRAIEDSKKSAAEQAARANLISMGGGKIERPARVLKRVESSQPEDE